MKALQVATILQNHRTIEMGNVTEDLWCAYNIQLPIRIKQCVSKTDVQERG